VKPKLIVKARADLDIAGHFLHLLGKNPVAARRFREAVKTAQKRIKQEPRGCATLPLPGFEDIESFDSVALAVLTTTC
jgi:plasmid stabilization system protein ParE